MRSKPTILLQVSSGRSSSTDHPPAADLARQTLDFGALPSVLEARQACQNHAEPLGRHSSDPIRQGLGPGKQPETHRVAGGSSITLRASDVPEADTHWRIAAPVAAGGNPSAQSQVLPLACWCMDDTWVVVHAVHLLWGLLCLVKTHWAWSRMHLGA